MKSLLTIPSSDEVRLCDSMGHVKHGRALHDRMAQWAADVSAI